MEGGKQLRYRKPIAQGAFNRAFSVAKSQWWKLERTENEFRNDLEMILKETLNDHSAYPTIFADTDGGASAQWRAGRSYLVIEVSPEGFSFVYADLNGALVFNHATANRLDTEIIKTALERFTADLESVNPNWRDNFANL